MMAKAKFPEGVVDYDEAALMLGCSKRTLQRRVADSEIPEEVFYTITNRCGFKVAGLKKFIRDGGRKRAEKLKEVKDDDGE